MTMERTRTGHEYEDYQNACKLCGGTDMSVICTKAQWLGKEIFDREMRSIITEFGAVKSGKKLAKKVNRLYGRALRDAAGEKTDELYRTFEEHIRPKPRGIPAWAWRAMQRIILTHYV